jgi:hypothetical protein
MATIIKTLKISEQINVGTYKIETNDELVTELLKFDNGDSKVRYSIINTKACYLTSPIPKEYLKLVWQKAQQQQ